MLATVTVDLVARVALITISRQVRVVGQDVGVLYVPPVQDVVRRNQIVSVRYVKGGLEITATGRALGDAGVNEPVAVLNQSSKQMVQGIVQEDGWILAQ